jgi:type III secretory pathway component EscT
MDDLVQVPLVFLVTLVLCCPTLLPLPRRLPAYADTLKASMLTNNIVISFSISVLACISVIFYALRRFGRATSQDLDPDDFCTRP